jgi:hypothetical protein
MARACGQCHRADVAPSQPYASREAVEALVSRQMSFGAQVKQSEFPILVDYLLKYYSARRK